MLALRVLLPIGILKKEEKKEKGLLKTKAGAFGVHVCPVLVDMPFASVNPCTEELTPNGHCHAHRARTPPL